MPQPYLFAPSPSIPLALPSKVRVAKAPPLKCQGIKTRLVPFIARSIAWEGRGRWVEPFVGSGVVAFNLAPQRALLADTNPHLIAFYRGIAEGEITPEGVRSYLASEGRLLEELGQTHYYKVRERFNEAHDPLDFLFLNRACFNGVVRFNRGGGFNVPFCKKPNRFSPSYVTKIVNQVRWVAGVLADREWAFVVGDWRSTLRAAEVGDFVYADPPYSGRHTDYFSQWRDEDSSELAASLRPLPCGFALSTWMGNKYRVNPSLVNPAADVVVRTFRHYYHVGSTEALRNEMVEALVIKEGSEAPASTD